MKSSTDLYGRPFMKMAGTTLLFLLLIVSFFSKSTSFIALNSFHNSWLDLACILFTNAGDGLCAILIVAGCWLFHKRMIAVKLLVTFLFSGLVAQIIKQWFHSPRPKNFFAPQAYSHFIDGITRAGFNSFPSGHATTVFAIAAMLSFHIQCKKWSLFIYLFALFVCFTRVYLGDHFIEDVTAGMAIGIACSVCTETMLHNTSIGSWFKNQSYINPHEASASIL